MAAEARAMLDALMGSDRNDVIPDVSSHHHPDSTNSTPAHTWGNKNKKSCYDSDICPLYCAWGVDVYDLFTNTKSALGPNPYVCQADARTEFEGLPQHEKDRLGFEGMLCRKLSDLVRGCDRIVMRNKEKLRQEIARAAKARGDTIHVATSVKEELIVEAAECMAELEVKEEDVKGWIQELEALDGEWKDMWKDYKVLEKEIELEQKKLKEQKELETKVKAEEHHDEALKQEEEPASEAKDGHEPVKQEDTNIKQDPEPVKLEDASKEGECCESPATTDDKKEETPEPPQVKFQSLQTKLYKNSSLQQKLLTKLNASTSQSIVPLRDTLQNLTKQLYYIRTDTSYDKTVCEVSGNFMSSRDAEERIAAHYAGKQYVGWKMVREKLKELEKKFGRGGPPPMSRGGPGGYHGGGGGGPPVGHGGGGYGGPGGGPPPNHRGPPPGHYHGGSSSHRGDRRHHRERSRSRDRSDGRWERDRGGSSHSHSSHRGYKSSSSGSGRYHGSGGGRRDRRHR